MSKYLNKQFNEEFMKLSEKDQKSILNLIEFKNRNKSSVYKRQIEIMERYFELIIDLSYDYDGFNDVEGLKSLIDELRRYACLGRACNDTECIYTNGNDEKLNILFEKVDKQK